MLSGAAPVHGEGLDRAELLDAVHGALDDLAADTPLLVVVEDVHWADRSTRDLLTFLFTRPFRSAVTVVASYRTDDLHRRHPLRATVAEWARLPGVHRLQLGPLDDAGRELARRAADKLGSAGRRAFARGDLPAAMNLLRRAADLLDPDDPIGIDTRIELAEATSEAANFQFFSGWSSRSRKRRFCSAFDTCRKNLSTTTPLQHRYCS